MREAMKIGFDWLSKETGSALERAFYAGIRLAVGDECLTRLVDLHANTVRSDVRADAYQLAVWFAANWWRLRWEPPITDWSTDVDWRMSHSIASVGGGFVWPSILFAGDGDSIAIAAFPSNRDDRLQPIRYLCDTVTRISSADFEAEIDSFMEAVLSRAATVNVGDTVLADLWTEVREERQNREMFRVRKLEALCGYDPDDAPSDLIRSLIGAEAELGTSATDEVAAAGRHSADKLISEIESLQAGGGVQAGLPTLVVPPDSLPDERPWQRGQRLARSARAQLGLNGNPVSDDMLADIVKMNPAELGERTKSGLPFTLAMSTSGRSSLDVFFSSPWRTSRRFAVARLIGDSLAYSDSGRLLPATKAKTARQQFQRAFAQEFLCPFESLLETISGSEPDQEDIQNAAEHFNVSPMVVYTTMVNKGELDRETFYALSFMN